MSRRLRTLVCAAVLGGTALAGTAPAVAGASHSPIAGSGSSWSANAVNQWVADVEPNGLRVVFTSSGSAIGRKDFANRTTDFAVSDIGFQGEDKLSGESDTSQGRDFVYLPIVAGGTAFPYKLKVGGKQVRNLRLSGVTLAKIFTNQITNWNDPAVTADNNGRSFPSKPIIPVVHSEGSGSSAQFTRYLDTVYPSIWRPFFGQSGFTEYFPRKGNAIAQNGSDGVMNYVASDAADGSIGYDEYSYALGKNFPVAKIENANGYFTLPTQYNVAVALTSAKINQDKTSPDYLLQNLDEVYMQKDDRTYPMSSYSYMIIPTGSDDSRMTTAKRQTLADYLYYSICEGQKEIGPIGYSPLPINLAQASFEQINKLKTADPGVDLTKRDISTCGNPTFVAGQPTRNYLAEIAPRPAACDKSGAGPCGEDGQPAANQNPARTGGHGGGSGGGSSGTTGTPAGTTGALASVGTTGGSTTGTVGGSTRVVDPETGQVAPSAGTTGGADAIAAPVEVAADATPASPGLLALLAIALLVGAIAVPPVVLRRAGRAT